MTPQQILALPIEHSDIGETTIGGYLGALLSRVWEDGEGFSGKRPFGSSGWQWDVYEPLVRADVVTGSFDGDGYLEDLDTKAADAIIIGCIASVLAPRPAGAKP